MCFSATASFTAGTVLSATGVMTLKKTTNASEKAFASIPLIFGFQQFIEGVIWIAPQSSAINTVMTYAFAFFSNLFWPIYIPLSVLLMEKVRWRKHVLHVFLGIGMLTSIYLLWLLIVSPPRTTIVDHSLAYIIPELSSTTPPLHHFTLYFLATCICCFFSSHRFIHFFGVVAFISGILSYYIWTETFVSVWCFFMAIMSTIIFVFFHSKQTVSPKNSHERR